MNIFTLLAGRLVLIDSEIVPDAVTGQQRLESYKKKDFWLGATKKIEKFDYKRSYLKKMFFNQIDENLDNIFNKKFLSKEIKFFQFF